MENRFTTLHLLSEEDVHKEKIIDKNPYLKKLEIEMKLRGFSPQTFC